MFYSFLLSVILLLMCWSTTDADGDCSSAPNPRLYSGMNAQISSGQANNLRNDAGVNADLLTQIPAGSQVQVLSDKSCADGYFWYQVDYQGLVGWTAEGSEGEYWLIPVLSNTEIISPDNVNRLQIVNELMCSQGEAAEALAWSNDGSSLLWGCVGAGFYLTNWISQETLEIPLEDTSYWASLAAFYDSDTKFITYQYPDITVWDSSTGESINTFTLDASHSIDPDVYKDMLAVELESGVHLMNLQNLEEIGSLGKNIANVVYSLAFSPDGDRLVLGGDGDHIIVWTPETAEVIKIPIAAAHVQLLNFSPSGRYILAALCTVPNRGDCNRVELSWIDSSTGTITETWTQEDWSVILNVHFGEDLFFLNVDGRFDIIQISTSRRIYSSPVYHDPYSSPDILLSVDGRLLITSDANRLLFYGIPE